MKRPWTKVKRNHYHLVATCRFILSDDKTLNKIATNMANPVRFRLDYKSIFRKHCVVPETIRGGEVTDLPELTRTRVVWRYTNGGEARVVEPGVPKVLNVSGL